MKNICFCSEMHVTLIQKSMKKRDFVERLFSLSLQRMQLPEQLFSRYVCTHIKNNEYNEKYESLRGFLSKQNSHSFLIQIDT